jgi:formylglycine-generating enzyme required for sulfatase activity
MKKKTVIISFLVFILTMSVCGCKNSTRKSLDPGSSAPSALSYSVSPAVYTKGLPIVENVPSVTNTVTDWTVTPALPDGLSLNLLNGVISGTPVNTQSAKEYTITAKNSFGSTFTVILITVNISAPKSLTYQVTSCSYLKNCAIAKNKPSYAGTVTVWEVSPSLPSGLALDSQSGTISGIPDKLQSPMIYKITASNPYGSASVQISIAVTEVKPKALSYEKTSSVYTIGFPAAPNTPSYTGTVSSWSVSPSLPAGLVLDQSTGVISGTPSILKEESVYTVTASNSAGSVTAQISITVNDKAPEALSYATSAAVYTQLESITPNIPAVTGTVVEWLVDKNLPDGLILDSTTGKISGTPLRQQEATEYTITAVNSGGDASTKILITVNLSAPKNLVYSQMYPVYTINTVITDNSPSVSGSVVSYAITPDLPAGLIMNTSTGVISGTPTVISPVTGYTVTASNSIGSVTCTIRLRVSYSSPKNLSYAVTDATYTQCMQIVPNTPTVNGSVSLYSITPALPDGLILNSVTGVISGSPSKTIDRTTYTVTAENLAGSTSTTIRISVAAVAPYDLSFPSASDCLQNAPLSITPSVKGTVLTYSVSPPLPEGLEMDGVTGVISGTPRNAQAEKSYTVTGENSQGSTNGVVKIKINPSLDYSSGSASYLKNCVITVNKPQISETVTSWSISPAALPAGLSFSGSTGEISGTPTALQGAQTYTVTAVTDIAAATAVISIKVVNAFNYGVSDAVYMIGQDVSNAPSVSSGTSGSWSISPAVPQGLSFNTATGVISGTASVESGRTAYTVTLSGYSTVVHLAVMTPFAEVYSTGRKTMFTPSGLSIKLSEVTVAAGGKFPCGLTDVQTNVPGNSFYLAESETTWALWKEVYDWATDESRDEVYVFQNSGGMGGYIDNGSYLVYQDGKTDHPVTKVNWRDAVVWCNALTEYYNASNATKLSPVYVSGSTPIRNSGDVNSSVVDSVSADVNAKGFRLPVDTEWEYAARYIGTAAPSHSNYILLSGIYFAKGNMASGAVDVYTNSAATAAVAVVSVPSSAPVKSKSGDSLGLYDMSGNVWEWCFNASSGSRVIKGGSFADESSAYTQVGAQYSAPSSSAYNDLGFRFCQTK